MKYLTLLLMTLTLMLSCKDTIYPVDAYASFKKNAESADKAYDLFEQGNLEEMSAMWTDEMFWSPANTNDSLSKNDWVMAMKDWHSDFENFKFGDRQYYPGVDTNFDPNGSVRVYGTWNSTHKESGSPTETKYYAVIEYDESGKATGTMEWFDLGGVFDQIIEVEQVVEGEEMVDKDEVIND